MSFFTHKTLVGNKLLNRMIKDDFEPALLWPFDDDLLLVARGRAPHVVDSLPMNSTPYFQLLICRVLVQWRSIDHDTHVGYSSKRT